MNDEPTSRSSKTGATAAILVALPLLYVLSVGPVSCLLAGSTWCQRRPCLINAVMIVYSPLKPLFTHEYLGPPFLRYLSWWDELTSKPYVGPDPFAQPASDPFAQEPSSPLDQDPK